jgi:hypothetical protein
MAGTTLADRAIQIVSDLGIPKSDFAGSVSVSRNPAHQLTGGRHTSCSRSLAILESLPRGVGGE